jgi:hypothetical protein
MAVETLDRRTALEEAFDSAEADAKGEVYTPPVREEPVGDETPVVEEPAEKDPAEVEAEALEKAKPKERPRTRGVPPDERVKPDAAAKPEGETAPPTAKAASNLDKAPLGWGPTRDALWAKTPPEVRQIIDKRERDIQQGMSQAGTIRKIAEEYHQVIMPFENIIKSMNTTPREAITNVMQTATALIIGTQEQKCAVIAEMVQRYGVDLPQLDAILTEGLKNPGKLTHIGGNPNPGPLDPRLRPLFDLADRLQLTENQRQQKLQEEADAFVASVESEPHFDTVKGDMADIMEISAKRGYMMTIKEAYDKACQLHPEVSKLLPPKAKPAVAPADAVARARRAASSVKGSPGGPVTNGKTDRRAQLEAAWNEQ